MIRMKKKVVLGLLAGVLAASLAVPSYAASRKPIKSIALTIKANIQPDTDFGQEEIEIESNSNKYSVDGYDILNDDFEWRDDSVPRIQITLTAEEDYYFQSLPKDKITLKGGATFLKATRQDSSSTLLMDVELPSLQTAIRDVENLKLSDNGIATWDAISAAGSYEVRIYRDDKAVGASMVVDTNTCNCRDRMTKGDSSYTVKVRPVSRGEDGERGEWVESASVYITGDKAAQFRDNPTGGSGAWAQSPENGRWWYDNGDGTYPANAWKLIGASGIFLTPRVICRPAGSSGTVRSITVLRTGTCRSTA